jgi:hypothetical protein
MMSSLRFIVLAAGLSLASTSGAVTARATQPNQQTDQQTLNLIDRLNRDARQFDRLVDTAMGRDPYRPSNPTQAESDVDDFVNQLTDTARHLREHVVRRQVIDSDVQEVMIRGARIDEFMRRNRFSSEVQSSWTTVRRELDDLAQTFNLSWNWSSPNMRPSPGPAYYTRLSGTYRLDPSRSDDVTRIASQATRSLPAVDRQRVESNLQARLDPPTSLAIDRNGQSVSIVSERAPRSTFDVDGRSRTETGPNGNTWTTRASLYGDQLAVTTTGSRGRDYTVTFEPLDTGNGLEVTRSLEVAGLTTPVTSRSVYRRTSDRPDWSLYQGPGPGAGPGPGSPRENGPVPVGTVLTGHLNTPLGSGTSKQGDRFSMSVDGPAPYRGASLDGVVTRVSSGGGRNELIFDFDRIRLRDGRTEQFEGTLSQVRTPNGKVIAIDTEGTVRAGNSQSTQAVQGGAIGAAIGAIIGAVAGGGKGAAIGAAIGAGAGAGGVYVVGSSVDLPAGTEVQIVSQPIYEGRLQDRR